MCGLYLSNNPNIDKRVEKILSNRLDFRGPDYQSGIIHHGRWKLYHARLSIIGLENKYNQPYFSENGDVLLFNGEILNYQKLAKKYLTVSRDSDTAVLAELLKIPNFNLNELEGFYAFTFIDKYGDLKFCVRDRFGVKPLFYHKDGEYITICSEPSVLAELFSRKVNTKAIDEYRVFRAPLFQESYFNDIHSLEPGLCLINGRYFDSSNYYTEDYYSDDELNEELTRVVALGVNSRMISDVPVGLLYSGGVDSNIIDQYTGCRLKKFTGGIAGDYDLNFAQFSDGDVSAVTIDPECFVSMFSKMTALRNEPLSVSNEVVLSVLAHQWSSAGGKVLLSGEAADEFFGGYDRIFSWGQRQTEFHVEEFLSRYAYVKFDDIPKHVIENTKTFFEDYRYLSPFEAVRQFFIKKHLPVLFRRLDFSLMMAGVEGREPLAHTDIFRLSMKMKADKLMRNQLGKLPLRILISKTLGRDFAFERKVGFPVDLRQMFYGEKSSSQYDNYNVWVDKNLGELGWL